MKGGVYFDPEAKIVGEHVAVVRAAQAKRKRFPENVVELMPDEAAALAAANPAEGFHAGIVAGPSRSSEGFRMYYLVRWLDGGPQT
jgi:hypothetical protein